MAEDQAMRIARRIAGRGDEPTYMPERDMRRLTRAKLYGEDVSPEDEARLASHAQRGEIGTQQAADAGWEATGVPGVGRAARDTYNDPSIANATNLAGRAALTAFRPALAAKALGAGLGAAALQGSGVFGSTANAADDGLNDAQRTRLDALQKKQAKGVLTRAEREEQNSYLGIQAEAAKGRAAADAEIAKTRGISEAQADAAKRSKEQEEYDRSVKGAERARDTELSRDRRFSDTPVGKVWDKAAGWGPMAVGGAFGALSRAATGGGKPLYDYGLPAVIGGLAGAASNNVPLAYNAFQTEPDNPIKRGYEVYARELPPGHPRKEEWTKYARDLPNKNPVREAAGEELYDPRKAFERMLFGAAEGIGGGLAGADAVRMPGRIVEAAAGIPGRARGAYARSNVRAEAAEQEAINAGETTRLARDNAENAQRTAARNQQLEAEAEKRTAEAQRLEQGAVERGASTARSSASPASQTSTDQGGGLRTPASQGSTPGPTSSSQSPAAERVEFTGGNGPAQVIEHKHSLDDGVLDRLAKAIAGRGEQAPQQTVKQLPKPDNAGPWAGRWSAPAREVIVERVGSGGNLAKGKGGLTQPGFAEQIGKKLPPGVEPPSRTEAGKRLQYIRDDIGEAPTLEQLQTYFKNVPPTRFAVPLTLAGGAAAISPDDAMAEVRRRRPPALNPPPGILIED